MVKKKKWIGLVASLLLVVILGIVVLFSLKKPGPTQQASKTEVKQEKKTSSTAPSLGQPLAYQSVLQSHSAQPLATLGMVAVPAVGINLPIFEGADETQIAYGAGTCLPNLKMGQGNYSLASHNVTGFDADVSLLFTPLENATLGMKIYVTDGRIVYQYKIDKISYVDPTDVSVLDGVKNEKIVTLVTCHNGATQREIVRGSLEASYAFLTAPDAVHNYFKTSYNQIPM
jgi:sortase A